LLAVTLAAAGPAPKLDADVVAVVNGEPIRLRDLDDALFLDDHAHYLKDIQPFLIRERVVRQKMSDRGISVQKSEVHGYFRDLDRMLKTRRKTSLREQLKRQGMTEAFFLRRCEQVVGLYRLVGGKGRASRHLTDPRVNAAMNKMLADLEAGAKKVVGLDKLPAGTAAIVNGEKISIAQAGEVARIGLPEEIRRERLKVLVYYFLARQELRRRGLEFTRDDMEYQIHLATAAKATRIGEKEFPLEKVLKKLGRDVSLLKRQYGFRAVAMLTKMVKSQVTEDELKKVFAREGPRFGNGVPKASHIYVKAVDKRGRILPARERRRKQDLAESIYKKLVDGRQDFAKLAGEFSEDERTAGLGGNLGFISYSKIKGDAVARTAYSLKVGEISRPVFGRNGWHIVKVTEVNRATFDTAKPLVMASTVARHRAALLKELQKKAEIKPGPARP